MKIDADSMIISTFTTPTRDVHILTGRHEGGTELTLTAYCGATADVLASDSAETTPATCTDCLEALG